LKRCRNAFIVMPIGACFPKKHVALFASIPLKVMPEISGGGHIKLYTVDLKMEICEEILSLSELIFEYKVQKSSLPTIKITILFRLAI
jgi:hypothetical protein